MSDMDPRLAEAARVLAPILEERERLAYERGRAERSDEPSAAEKLLALSLPENDAGAATVREYLVALAREVWREGEGFSGKRPFGNSGWHYELYGPMAKAGLVRGDVDDDGCVDYVDKVTANGLIFDALDELAGIRRPVDHPV